MTPTQARAFLAVAIEGSFTGAAKRLNLSQPSVTTQVGLLERQYKVELFHRIGRGVRLTPAGNALLPTVRRLFTSLDEATAYLEDLRGQRQGYLRVGSYTPHRFIVLVSRYKKRFPGAFNLGRVCEFAGACKKSAQLRAQSRRDRPRERPTQFSLACVHSIR